MSSIKTGVSGAGGLVTSYKSANFTAASGFSYLVNTTSGAVTPTLPSGSAGAQVQFVDDAGTWAANGCVVTPASGQTIQGLAANDTLTLNISGAFVVLSWDSTNAYWVVTGSGFQYGALATVTSPGLVSTTTQSFAGAKTLTGLLTPSAGIVGGVAGVAIASGVVGEILTVAGTGLTLGASYANIANLTLSAGVWSVTGFVMINSAPTGRSYVDATISTSSGVAGTIGVNRALGAASTVAGTTSVGQAVVPIQVLTYSTSTTIHIGGMTTTASSASSDAYNITAVRIA